MLFNLQPNWPQIYVSFNAYTMPIFMKECFDFVHMESIIRP